MEVTLTLLVRAGTAHYNAWIYIDEAGEQDKLFATDYDCAKVASKGKTRPRF